MAYIIWLTLLILFVFSFLSDNKISLWIPVTMYLIVVIFRLKSKIGDYKDWLKISQRDEGTKINQISNEMAQRGLTFSGIRDQKEKEAHEDFFYQRKKKKREFENEIINSLFLK